CALEGHAEGLMSCVRAEGNDGVEEGLARGIGRGLVFVVADRRLEMLGLRGVIDLPAERENVGASLRLLEIVATVGIDRLGRRFIIEAWGNGGKAASADQPSARGDVTV